ncbi:LADA_0G06700g1_1 [Lachancea dasiensis]|uniref:LADA_0G06700g1_1 n=1 Tax=Lachancea dasiensis TaxID=1072105 RepID=A0A1G4JT95_9SACH|nr:LADA_0G06700g1_1 [Lachancea dasiensis]
MHSQQPQHSAQQLYGNQGFSRTQPLYPPDAVVHDTLTGPRTVPNHHTHEGVPQASGQSRAPINSVDLMASSVPQHNQMQGHAQRMNSRIQPTPQSPIHQQRPQQAQQLQMPPNLPPNGSNPASAMPSPFAASQPTPTGAASVHSMNNQGLAPGPAIGHIPKSAANSNLNGPIGVTQSALHAAPGAVPFSASTGVAYGSPHSNQNDTVPNFSAAYNIPQDQTKRHLPSSSMPYPMRKYLSNMAILRLHEIVNLINISTGRAEDFDYWMRFTNDLFTPNGILRYSTKGGEETRQFEFTTPIIPLVCQSLGAAGVVRSEILPQQLRAQVLSNNTIFFDCPRCTTTYFYPDGSNMTNFSQIKGIFDSNLKMVWVEITSYSFVPGIEWSSLERLITSSPVCHEIFQELSGNQIKSENSEDDSKRPSAGNGGSRVPTNFSAITKLRSQFGVFNNISSFGVQESFMRSLQVNDVISYLKNLKVYQKANKLNSPLASLESIVASSQAEKAVSIPASAPSNYTNSMLSPVTATSYPRTKNSFTNRPLHKKRRSSEVSPLNTEEKTPTPKQENGDMGLTDKFKRGKY